jgi:hypothetical protein
MKNRVGISKYQIKSVTMYDGTVIELDNIPNVLIVKEGMSDDGICKLNQSYNAHKDSDYITLSNSCMVTAFALQMIHKTGVSWEEAVNQYFEYRKTHTLEWVEK